MMGNQIFYFGCPPNTNFRIEFCYPELWTSHHRVAMTYNHALASSRYTISLYTSLQKISILEIKAKL